MLHHMAIVALLTDLYRATAPCVATMTMEKAASLPRHFWHDWEDVYKSIQTHRKQLLPEVIEELDHLSVTLSQLRMQPHRHHLIPEHLKDTSSKVAALCQRYLLWHNAELLMRQSRNWLCGR